MSDAGRLPAQAVLGRRLRARRVPDHGATGAHGKQLADDDLDACHGTTSKIKVDGKKVKTYHYAATNEYPYTLGCFRGTPATTSTH